MNKVTKTLLVSSITNFILSFLKIIVGLLGGSSALIADGVHSLSDLSTDLIAILGGFLSNKPADKEHPFGHGKFEYITSVIIGIVIIILGGALIYNVVDSNIVIPNVLTIFVSLFTIVSKLILSIYIISNGKKLQNNILIASGKESRADVYSSICVFISIILMQFTTSFSFLQYANILATIIVALMIIKTGYGILKENISILLEEQITDKNYIKEVSNIILSFEKVLKISDLYILRYGPYLKLISTIIMEENISLSEAHEVINKVEEKIKTFDNRLKYIFIHMEPNKF